MDKEELQRAITELATSGRMKTKQVFRVVTVPTVENFSNIGFEGLQELADKYRKVGREFYSNDDEENATASMGEANKCEELFDKYNGKSTLKVSVDEIVQDCTLLMNDLFPDHVYLAAQGRNDSGMFFDFVLGPSNEELVRQFTQGECDCPTCTAAREAESARVASIPKDQLN